jgi:hypothetical protein
MPRGGSTEGAKGFKKSSKKVQESSNLVQNKFVGSSRTVHGISGYGGLERGLAGFRECKVQNSVFFTFWVSRSYKYTTQGRGIPNFVMHKDDHFSLEHYSSSKVQAFTTSIIIGPPVISP